MHLSYVYKSTCCLYCGLCLLTDYRLTSLFLSPFQLASIIQRDGSNCQALVRVTHSDDLLALEYDEICEYVGDITDR